MGISYHQGQWVSEEHRMVFFDPKKKLMIRGVPKTIEPLLQDVADGVSLRISGCSMFSFSIQFQGCNVGNRTKNEDPVRFWNDFGYCSYCSPIVSIFKIPPTSTNHPKQILILGWVNFWWILVILNEQKKAQRHRSRICWSLGPHLRTRRAWWGGWTGEGSAGEMKIRGDQNIFQYFFNHILFHISNISYQILCFDDMFHIVSSYLAMLLLVG